MAVEVIMNGTDEKEGERVESVFPIRIRLYRGQTKHLPGAAAVTMKDGTVAVREVSWTDEAAASWEQGSRVIPGSVCNTGTKIEAVIETEEGAEPLFTHEKKAEAFPMDMVRLLPGSPYYEAQQRNLAYLLTVDDDQMLYNFRVQAGLDTKGASPMIGWDAPDCLLRGHTTGHYLSALSLCFAATGEERIREKARYIAQSLAECQNRFSALSGYHDGYLGGYSEEQFDKLETYTRYPDIWAPYYTLHKILAGLLDCFEYCGEKTALRVAERLGYWVYRRLSRLPRGQRTKMWGMYIAGEFGGMNEVMARLHRLTGENAFLETARYFDNDKLFFPLLQGADALGGLHANQHIPQAVGAIKLYEQTGESSYYEIAKRFW